MFKAAVSAAVVLSIGLFSPASAQQQWGAASSASASEASADPRRALPSRDRAKAELIEAVVTEGHIARLRAALRLTPAQLPYWAPVESALNELVRQQARGEAAGASAKFSDRSAAIAATATQLRRLKAIAMPLIQTLDDNQKREAIAFARQLGFQQLVAAF